MPINKTLHKKIVRSIQKGFLFLEAEQKQAGNFIGQAFTLSTPKQKTISETPFTTSLIANAIYPLLHCSALKKTQVETMGIRAANYLLSEKEPSYLAWNYWEKKQPLRKTLPADMDDTALAFAAIALWKREAVDGEALAGLAQTLITAERKAGGPYNTWLTHFKKQKTWDDCDVAVNANIAYMLSLLDIKLTNLTAYFEESLKNNALSSKYYFSPVIILYFIGRSMHRINSTKKSEMFIREMYNHQQSDGTWGTPLLTAVALSGLHYFGVAITNEEKALTYLLRKQAKSWPTEAFYFERGDKDTKWYHGTEALTTSLCLEALSFAIAENTDINQPIRFAAESKNIVDAFILAATRISDDFGKHAAMWADKIMRHPWIRESVLVPLYIAETLPANTLQTISYANLLGWIGYSIIDSILDNEANVTLLPFANYCLREMNVTYVSYLNDENISLYTILLNETDRAYANEIHLRLVQAPGAHHLQTFTIHHIPVSEMETASGKSIGQAIAGVVTLQALGNEHRKYVQSMVSFYRHFLEAKQTLDDAEDLMEDLCCGRITKPGAMVLNTFLQQNPETTTIHMPAEKNRLLSIFWNEVFVNLYHDMKHNLDQASSIAQTFPATYRNHFSSMTQKLRASIEKTHHERNLVQGFLNAYK